MQGFTHENHVGIAIYELACRAEVDYPSGSRGYIAESVNVGHHIVSKLFFILIGCPVVDVIEVLSHLLELLGGNVQAKCLLRFRQSQPKLPPCGKLPGLAEQLAHLDACVSTLQRAAISATIYISCIVHERYSSKNLQREHLAFCFFLNPVFQLLQTGDVGELVFQGWVQAAILFVKFFVQSSGFGVWLDGSRDAYRSLAGLGDVLVFARANRRQQRHAIGSALL
jgi:hypothetical protein